MPLDCEDVDESYGEKKVFDGETSESSVDLDYKSNIELAKTFSKLSMKEDKMYEKDQEDLKSLMAQMSLTEEKSRNLENDEEIISRAPIGGVPVMPENYLSNSNYLYNNNNNNNNSYTVGSKPKRSYVENEVHAVKYTKPTEHSMLQLQCSTLSDFPNHHIEYNHQTSGGIMTINPSSSVASNEEYDSSFSPGESSYGSPAEDVPVVSPVSDYSSMAASPDNNESAFDETHLKDLCEIIEKDLVKEKLEKALSEDLPQSVPQQALLPSSSPPSLYNNSELYDIIGDLLKSESTYLSQANKFDEQLPVTNKQPLNTGSVNLNHIQFIQDQQQQQYRLQYQQQQQQQAQTVTYSNPQHYNLPCQLPNNKYEQQYPPAPQIISTVNQFDHSLNYTQSQQPIMSPNYNQQQNQLDIKPSTISNRNFTSQQRMPTSSQQFAFQQQPQVQPQLQQQQQPQMITTATTNQQHFSLPQHQTTAYNSIPMTTSKQQYTTSSSQQHVTTTPTGCSIPTTPLTVPQPSPGAPDQNIKSTSATSSNKAVIIVAPPSTPNSIMLLPTTNSQVIYIPQIPMQPTKPVKPSPRTILPKPPNNSDPNQIDLKRITPVAKGRRDKDKSSQQLENQGQGNLCVARRCVAGMKEGDLENMDSDGDNYLHVAVCKTDVYMIEALLERLNRSGKLNMINKQNNLRQTPLYLAVSANQPAMVHKLIRYGANVNLKGMTCGYKTEKVERAPIHCAASQGKDYCDTLKELFKSENIDPDILNSKGLSALHCAIIEHGKLVRNQNSYGTKIDNCQNVSLLLKNKANPNLPDRCSGKTPLMYAIESKDYSMVEAILKAVESSKIPELLKAKTFDGRTCMKIADGLRTEFDPHTWQKLYNILSTVN